ncbi:TOBE domain-containing protein [Syntrophomonas wolfei]|uniref:Molybdenum-pterin-binding protein n=1 Tax=Syntrophomonas wolfei subsp. wolfei (strain DSM 2245B / Goettingen) TaxID=335541 RepID=Q0AXQ5_SYNWW|nr:TOBE domain-containing protein [Syntrophomonas wolfei]ABI68499.1 molybdenum-pterin-binding protein [Syntrophomonas wolfei subsp. wolfei str. Goettingen G311]
MNISARNQLKGKVASIQEGAVNAIVTLKTDGGNNFTSTISKEAVKELGLAPGKEAMAVIKATEVMIGLGEMKLSARNQLAGEIVNVQEGPVNAIVTVKTDGGNTLCSTISIAAIKELGLAPGIKAKAVIKSTSVMIAV